MSDESEIGGITVASDADGEETVTVAVDWEQADDAEPATDAEELDLDWNDVQDLGGQKSRAAHHTTKSWKVLSVHGIPQYKTEWIVRTVAKFFGKKIKTKVPRVYRRTSTRSVIIDVSYPIHLDQEFGKKIEKCGKIAAVIAAAAAIKGGPLGALTAFKGSFLTCAEAELRDEASKLVSNVRTETKTGPWKPI